MELARGQCVKKRGQVRIRGKDRCAPVSAIMTATASKCSYSWRSRIPRTRSAGEERREFGERPIGYFFREVMAGWQCPAAHVRCDGAPVGDRIEQTVDHPFLA